MSMSLDQDPAQVLCLSAVSPASRDPVAMLMVVLMCCGGKSTCMKAHAVGSDSGNASSQSLTQKSGGSQHMIAASPEDARQCPAMSRWRITKGCCMQAVRLLSLVTRILDLLKAGLTARAQACKDQVQTYTCLPWARHMSCRSSLPGPVFFMGTAVGLLDPTGCAARA